MTDSELGRMEAEAAYVAGWLLGLLLVVTTWLVIVGLAVAWVVIR